jgi:hypothetical protein
MRLTLQRWLDSPRVTVLAPLTTLGIGLFFVFVWAPHPWGWRGIDQYDALAKELALGQPFSTTDVPWGYTYYLAVFYRFFGEHTWAPVTGQVFINALTPLLVFMLARPAVGQRIAALAAWITAIFSFNTVYASTQSSDAICTVLFLLSLLCFVEGHRRSSVIAFAAAGVLSGIVPQFRPNMILLPVLVIAGYAFWPAFAAMGRLAGVSPELANGLSSAGGPPRGRRRLLQCAVFGVAMTAMLMPWIVRNYRYTGALLPTSTHGGIQLWYGTLQTGANLESRAHNPRSAFASAAFPYTSLEASIVLTGNPACGTGVATRLAYKTSRDATWRWIDGVKPTHGPTQFEIPAQPIPTTVYYYFQAAGDTTPPAGAAGPFLYFVSDHHLNDLDSNGEMLDIFDVARLARQAADPNTAPGGTAPDLNRDGLVDEADLSNAIDLLLPEVARDHRALARLERDGDWVTVRLSDGSWISVPPAMTRQTDLALEGVLASELVSRFRTMSSIPPAAARCAAMDDIAVNQVFYRREPHEMRRYTALAFDNIERDPLAFIAASAYRLVRLFIIRGTDDQMTTHQFPLSRLIFQAATWASAVYFAAFLAGVAIAWRARSPFLYALVPIAYVPLTICFVLTNMRYTITVQPLMFVFVAIAVAAMLKIGRPEAGGVMAGTSGQSAGRE